MTFIRPLAFVALALATTTSWAQSQVVINTMFCVQPGSANSRIDQKIGQGNCAGWLAGGALAGYLSGRGDIAAAVLSKNEYEIGVMAAQYACQKNPVSDQIAVRLINVCQCHNLGAQNLIDSNQSEAVGQLREWSKVTNKPC